MDTSELISHGITFLAGMAPTAGLILRERSRRQTAESKATEAEKQAALASSETVKVLATEALDRAKKAEDRAEKAEQATRQCEEERANDRDQCDRRVRAIKGEFDRLRRDLELSGTLPKSDPDRPVPPEVVEAWATKPWGEPGPGPNRS